MYKRSRDEVILDIQEQLQEISESIDDFIVDNSGLLYSNMKEELEDIRDSILTVTSDIEFYLIE